MIGLAPNLHGSLAAVRAHLTRSSARILSIRDDQERQALQAKCADYEARIADLIAQITTPIPEPSKAKPEPRKSTPSTRRLGAREFWDMHASAVKAINYVYGTGWKCRAPLGETVLASVPTGLRSYKTPTGSTVRWLRDHRMPAARFWPGGVLPAGLVLSTDVSRETKPRAWGNSPNGGPYNDGYTAWAKSKGFRSASDTPDHQDIQEAA